MMVLSCGCVGCVGGLVCRVGVEGWCALLCGREVVAVMVEVGGYVGGCRHGHCVATRSAKLPPWAAAARLRAAEGESGAPQRAERMLYCPARLLATWLALPFLAS